MTTGITTGVTKPLDQPRNNPLRLGNTRHRDHNKSLVTLDTTKLYIKHPGPDPAPTWDHALTHIMRQADTGTRVRSETRQQYNISKRMGGILIFILHNILITLAQIKLGIMTKNELLFFCHYVNFLFQNGDNYPDTKIIRILCILNEKMENISFKRYFLFSYYW